MKRVLFLSTLIFISLSSIFAEVTVVDFFGKVKVKNSGDSSWSKIEKGMVIYANSTLSTGFNSQITLDLGNATLDVLPLTRMTLSEITETQDSINTSLFLQGGKIKADVKKIAGKVNDFKIKSPVATASVRGTAFEFSGNKLKVIRGVVAFKPSSKPKADEKVDDPENNETVGVAVRAGGSTQMISTDSAPVKPRVMVEKERSTTASTKPPVIKKSRQNSLDGQSNSGVPVPSAVESAILGTTRVTITINPIEE